MGSYAPPPPPNGTPPGGFSCIITSQTIGPSGGTIGPLSDGALTVTVTIPPGTFLTALQVTISEPFGSGQCQGEQLTGLRGFRLVGGVGIEVSLGSEAFTYFQRPFYLRIGRLNFARVESEEVGVVSGSGHVFGLVRRRHEGPVTIVVHRSEVLAVFVRIRSRYGFGCCLGGRATSVSSSSGELLTDALLPAGSPLPGLGVLRVASGGSAASVTRADLPVSQ
jgi:hypothetical protein